MNWIKITKENYKDIPIGDNVYFTTKDSTNNLSTFKGSFEPEEEDNDYTIWENNEDSRIFVWDDDENVYLDENDNSVTITAYCILEPFRE